MRNQLTMFVRRIFEDRFLQCLLLGVIAAGFFFAFVLEVDISVVMGVLVMGGVTAFIESSHRRPDR